MSKHFTTEGEYSKINNTDLIKQLTLRKKYIFNIEEIVDLKIENKSLDNYKYNTEGKLKASENIISNLKLEITNMRLILEELQKEKGIN